MREEEIFTVLEGEYEFYREGEWTPMEIGVAVLSPRNTFHAFRNVGKSAAKMMLVTNGGGIDEYFRAISALKLPRDYDQLNTISAQFGYFYL